MLLFRKADNVLVTQPYRAVLFTTLSIPFPALGLNQWKCSYATIFKDKAMASVKHTS